jgi:hypothetical protein
MLPAITTTHAIPRSLPAGSALTQETAVKCSYCLSILGVAKGIRGRVALQAAHTCAAKRLAMRPSASLPYN